MTHSERLSATEHRFYREIRKRIREQLERAQLTPYEEKEKLCRYTDGRTSLASKPRPGLLIAQLWNRILALDPQFADYYTFATFRNLLTPSYPYRLPFEVIGLVALALKVPPIVLLPVEVPDEPLPGTGLYRHPGRAPSELEELLVETSTQIASLSARRPDLAEQLMQEVRNAAFQATYAAQNSA